MIDDMDFTPLVAPALTTRPAPTRRELAIAREGRTGSEPAVAIPLGVGHHRERLSSTAVRQESPLDARR